MKVIIEQGGVKRSIEGSFNISIWTQDAKSIVAILEKFLREAGENTSSWITIYDVPETTVNLPAKKWDEA